MVPHTNSGTPKQRAACQIGGGCVSQKGLEDCGDALHPPAGLFDIASHTHTYMLFFFPTFGVGLLDFKLNFSPRPELFWSAPIQIPKVGMFEVK